MSEYLIAFTDEWVPDHTVEEVGEQSEAVRALLVTAVVWHGTPLIEAARAGELDALIRARTALFYASPEDRALVAPAVRPPASPAARSRA